jgi:PAS domain S-box-containing protein
MALPSKPKLGLTAWLAILVVGAIVPLLLFAGLTLRGVFQTSRTLADRGQADTARALALAVDGEVHGWRAGLLTLASSASLQIGRWAEFYEEAREVATRYEGWVVLNPETGPQRLNTLRPFGALLPQTAASEMVQAVFRDGKPVTDMTFGAVAQRYVISNSIPVFRDGKVVFCLSLNFGPERLTRLLQKQQFPETWVAAINDSQRRVVGRSREAESRVGKPVVEWFAAATRAAESGIVTGPLMDGRLGQIAFQRLTEAPWVVALAVPVEELQSAAPIWGFLSIGVILGFVAVGIAVYMGRKVLVPVTNLARVSERLIRGETGDIGPPTTIREVQELQQAFIEASATARARSEERERNAQALQQANAVLEVRVAERTAALARAMEALQAVNSDLLQEIAQRVRAEEEIQALARFPSENPNPVLRLDSVGRILFANAASAPVLDQWGSTVGGHAPEPWRATVRDALSSRSGTTVELACADRTYIVFVAPVSDAGYVNLYTTDITERKTAAEALRESRQDLNRAQAVAHIGSWRLNVRRNELTWSDENWRIFGVPRGTPLTYETFLGTVHPEDRDYVHENWSAALRGAPYDIEHRIVVDDAVKWVRERAELEFDPDGNLLGGFGTTQDITARKEAEAALQRLNAELEQRVSDRTAALARAVQTLERQAAQLRSLTGKLTLAEQRERRRLADVLHDEMQQLLVATRLRAHMLGRAGDAEIRQGSQEIVDLMDEALAATRSLTAELSPPTLRNGNLLPALGWLTSWMQQRHKITVRLAEPTAPVPLLSDDHAVLVYQCVRELLLNTVKYARVEAADVTVTQDADGLKITVADEGVGFDPGSLRLAGGSGGGFGLLGIRERLESVGGHLEIASAPGDGSRFTLTVPLSAALEGVPSRRPAVTYREMPKESPAAPRLRVLVVDDHALVRRGFATMLAGEPDLIVVGEAADGQMAIELTRQLAPDVVLMDVSMPVLDGIAAARAIHAEFPAVRVIGLSVFEAVDQPAAMREAGAVGYLSKSDSAETLLAAIRGGGESEG